jgi:ABC-2 type transport system permease protein
MSGAGALARAEILRSRSGSSFPVLLAYAILIPLFALNTPGTTDRLGGLDGAEATRTVFGFAACAALGACFYGSYAYTRETYYHSLDRSLLLGSRDAILAAKALAGAVSGAVFGVVAVAAWWPITAVVLATAGRRITVDASLLTASVGVVLACTLSGVLGVGIGYAVRNYYACIPIVLVLPAALAAVPTERESTVPATVDRLLHSFFGDRFPRSTSCWTTAHGDLHPGNLLVAPLGIADWEAWGRGPEHLDVATLYVHSLAAPDARRSLLDALGERLHSDAARPALAFAAAKVLARSVSGDYPMLVDPVHRLLDDLTARPLGAGGTTARRR